jgi:hypothetical protein
MPSGGDGWTKSRASRERMNVEAVETVDTLGMRLDRMGRRLIARRLPAMPWLRALQPVLRRATTAAATRARRFDRVEANLAPWTPPSGARLPTPLRDRVERFTGPGLEALRVHDGPAASRVAEAHESRAVAMGTDVFFNRGEFQPETPAGFGLLVHEATHVLEALRPGADWRRSTHAGVQREESRAERAQAAAAASYRLAPEARSTGALHLSRAPAVAVSAGEAGRPAERPMRAVSVEPTAPSTPQAGGVDVDKLRAQIYRDLLRQLRTDFERGA